MEMLFKTELRLAAEAIEGLLRDLARYPRGCMKEEVEKHPGNLCRTANGSRILCVRGNGWQCPVARYVRRRLKANVTVQAVRVSLDGMALEFATVEERRVSCSGEQVDVEGELCWHRVALPAEVAEFEREFQAGKHPWLEA